MSIQACLRIAYSNFSSGLRSFLCADSIVFFCVCFGGLKRNIMYPKRAHGRHRRTPPGKCPAVEPLSENVQRL